MKRIGRIAGALAALGLAAGLTLAGTGTARADVTPPTGQWAEIYNLAGGLCLTAQNLLAGKPLTLGTCNRATTTGQIWWELPAVNGPASPDFEIFPWPVNYTYNTCVAASNFTDANGTRLVMAACDRYDTSTLWNLG